MRKRILEAQTDEEMGYWPRDYELCNRATELLLHPLLAHPEVAERSNAQLEELGSFSPPPSIREIHRYRRRVSSDLVNLIAAEWVELHDTWDRSRATHVFENGHAACFFLRLLWGNQNVLLRGQGDARWTLRTSMERAREQGQSLMRIRRAASAFIEAVEAYEPISRYFPRGLSKDHRQAVLQHYGFPTDFLDFTYHYDIALYFAEGTEKGWQKDPVRSEGAIYSVPIHMLPPRTPLLTLPPAIMRPSLQKGVFVRLPDAGLRARMEQLRVRFRFQPVAVSSGLLGIGYRTSPSLGRYLFPTSDPLEAMAAPIRRSLLATEE